MNWFDESLMLGYILSSLSIHTVALLDYPVVPIYWPNLPNTRKHAFGLIGPLAGSEIFRRSISLHPYPTMGELLPSYMGFKVCAAPKGILTVLVRNTPSLLAEALLLAGKNTP